IFLAGDERLIDLAGAGATAGTPLQLIYPNGSTAQAWLIQEVVPAGSAILDEAAKKVQNK
ncbi:hypothetical protein H0H87_004489, partial [Tephrocybe sp. NHM501043]